AGQDPAQPPRGAGQTQDLVEQWKAELAAAKLRRTKGRHLEAGGFVVAIGADVLAGLIAGHCRSGDCAFAPIVGLTRLAGGIAMGIRGRDRVQDANVEIEALLVRGPKGGSSGPAPLGSTSGASAAGGRAIGVAWRVRW